METSLRIVLLLVAAGIIIGIIWDLFCSKRKKEGIPANNSLSKPQKSTSKEQSFKKNPFSSADDFSDPGSNDPFDDVILGKTKIAKTKENPTATAEQLSFPDANEILDPSEEPEDEQDFQLHSLKKNVATKEKDLKQNHSQQKSQFNGYAQDLVILNVMARKPGIFLGKKLVEALQEAHVYFGEMNIFHRHENSDGTGHIIFSIASAVEPGMFEISKMDTCVTQGITLFFHAERRNQSIAAFELMLRTAKQISMRLDAELKDDEHKFVSLHTIEKYRERMRQGYAQQSGQFQD